MDRLGASSRSVHVRRAAATRTVANQLAATVGVTVLYIVGAAAATTFLELFNPSVLPRDWVRATGPSVRARLRPARCC